MNVEISTVLYAKLSRLVESMGLSNVAGHAIQAPRDEVDRAESDKVTTAYMQREIKMIRKLIRDAEWSD